MSINMGVFDEQQLQPQQQPFPGGQQQRLQPQQQQYHQQQHQPPVAAGGGVAVDLQQYQAPHPQQLPQQQPPPLPQPQQHSQQHRLPHPEHFYPQPSQPPPCKWLVNAVKWIPVLFIVSIIGWSYYAYVVQLCIMSVATLTEQVLFLTFYHFVFAMFFWSYWQTVFTPVAVAPDKFKLSRVTLQQLSAAETAEQHRRILEQIASQLPISNRTFNGGVRFCDKCLLVKPDRSHHCSVCGTCVLKMDHHCPWVNNCVNFTNYKYFVLFLGYALLYCLYVALTSLKYFVLFWEGSLSGGMGRFHILFLFFVSVMFAISLVSLFGYHVYLVSLNRTTLEAFRAPVFRVGGPDKNGFHLGYRNNLQEVFGDDRSRWFLPVFSSKGDACEFQLPEHQRNISLTYDSMGQRPAALVVANPMAAANAAGDNATRSPSASGNSSSNQLYSNPSSSSNSRQFDGVPYVLHPPHQLQPVASGSGGLQGYQLQQQQQHRPVQAKRSNESSGYSGYNTNSNSSSSGSGLGAAAGAAATGTAAERVNLNPMR